MNALQRSLRNIEAQRLRERDEQMAMRRGAELPTNDRKRPTEEVRLEQEAAREELKRKILELHQAHPGISASEIGKRVETSHTTVLSVLRKAGIKTKPQGWAP